MLLVRGPTNLLTDLLTHRSARRRTLQNDSYRIGTGRRTRQAKLEASDAATDDRFGYDVDIDGDTAVVGTFGNDTAAGTNAGAAYVFTRSGVTWSEQVILEADDTAFNDQFGWSVAISGVNVVVGARLDDTTVATDAGSAYFFRGVSEPSDALTLSESIQATTTKAAADSLGVTDSVTLGLSPSDALTVADSTSLGHGLPSSDSLALADNVTLGLSPSDVLSIVILPRRPPRRRWPTVSLSETRSRWACRRQTPWLWWSRPRRRPPRLWPMDLL